MLNLLTVKARDLMEREVVQLQTLTPIEEAVQTLEEYEIHGAPVCNEGGELVGTLTATDILKRDHANEENGNSRRPAYYAVDPFSDDVDFFSRDEYPAEILDREIVADWMTPRVFSVSPSANLAEVCLLMEKEKIHRVFVVEDGELLGVISTFDIVKRLAEEASVGSSG